MALYKLNPVTSKSEEFAVLKADIETLLSSGKKYVVNFYPNQPSDEVLNAEESIIINTEYPAIGGMLVNLTNSYPNFNYGEYSAVNMHTIKWMAISEDNSR